MEEDGIHRIVEKLPVAASAPCRIDLGGTLDLDAFHLALGHLQPSTFNIAIDLRTVVRLRANQDRTVRISSRGFDDVAYELEEAPFDHPLGLMLAVAVFFRAKGVWIDIDSASPPRSALGGSSAAAVALIAACAAAREKIGQPAMSRQAIVSLAHALEQAAAGVICGRQDHLAAAFGGVNQWSWRPAINQAPYRRRAVVRRSAHRWLDARLMLAYCGVPHVSKDINGRWVRQFIAGRHREEWNEILACTHGFVQAMAGRDLPAACAWMNRETAIRRKLTPDVVDEVGSQLVDSARDCGCAARFTGAGGGGCIWALGETEALDSLKPLWLSVLATRKNARMLDFGVDGEGVRVETGAGRDRE